MVVMLKIVQLKDYFFLFISNLTLQTNRIQVLISNIKTQPFFLSFFPRLDFLKDRTHSLSDLSSVLNGGNETFVPAKNQDKHIENIFSEWYMI